MSRHHQVIKNDPRWKAARLACLERDGHQCVIEGCEETEGLQVDHIEELAVVLSTAPDLAFDLDNLQTLCRPHHDDKGRQRLTLTRNTWINPRYGMLNEMTTLGL